MKFCLFSTNFPPIFRLWYPICRFSAPMLMEFAYFHLFSVYFLPKMVFSAYVPLIFFLFSAHHPIFRLTFRPFLPVLSCRVAESVAMFSMLAGVGICIYSHVCKCANALYQNCVDENPGNRYSLPFDFCLSTSEHVNKFLQQSKLRAIRI